MKTQHTPFKVAAVENHFVVTDANGNFFAETYSSFNANQIAALPELLSALQELTDWTYNQSAPLESIRDKARSSIAKATGN